jgi:transposase
MRRIPYTLVSMYTPSLIPKKPGERIKIDRRDALKLAECYRGGLLTPVWVPDAT